MLDAGDGNTAIGNCSVEPNKNYGTCTFWAGSGTLRGFQALVTLSPVEGMAGSFHWVGFYNIVTCFPALEVRFHRASNYRPSPGAVFA